MWFIVFMFGIFFGKVGWGCFIDGVFVVSFGVFRSGNGRFFNGRSGFVFGCIFIGGFFCCFLGFFGGCCVFFFICFFGDMSGSRIFSGLFWSMGYRC